ncbi:unnamed protein product, partial [Mesorhabditis spiculigera]
MHHTREPEKREEQKIERWRLGNVITRSSPYSTPYNPYEASHRRELSARYMPGVSSIYTATPRFGSSFRHSVPTYEPRPGMDEDTRRLMNRYLDRDSSGRPKRTRVHFKFNL